MEGFADDNVLSEKNPCYDIKRNIAARLIKKNVVTTDILERSTKL